MISVKDDNFMYYRKSKNQKSMNVRKIKYSSLKRTV